MNFSIRIFWSWKKEQSYDFVYSRNFFNQLRHPLAMLKQIYNSLTPQGLAMIEDLDFSKLQCFPNSFAFSHFVELFTTVKKQQGVDANIGNKLSSLFQQANFSNIQVQLVSPSFLTGESKKMASLTLESIAPLLLDEILITPTELQALLIELKAFEENPHTMITLPGIYQAWGERTNSDHREE